MAERARETAQPMHPQDRRFMAIFNWAGNVGGALAVGCYIALAMGQMRLRFAAPGIAVGLIAMTGATILAFRKPAAPIKRQYSSLIMIVAMILTWGVFVWQAWMWFHPAIQPAGYTQAQLDDYAAKKVALATKPLQDKLDQANKELESFQHGDAGSAKVIAGLRAQIIQLQSDKPIDVGKLPTSMRVSFNNDATYTQLDEKNIAAWEPITLWNDPGGLLVRPQPVTALFIVFKRPIVFDDVKVEGLNSSIIGKAVKVDSRFAIVELDASSTGLFDITIVQNKHGK